MAAKRRGEWTEILISQGTISPDQLAEAQQMVSESDTKLPDTLSRLGYATGEEITRAMAQQFGLDYVNLSEVVIPPSVVELVPESVARENVVLPLAEGDGKLTVIVSNPNDYDTIDKLRFILNCLIEIALAPRESILEAINRHYGQTVGESADSMLQEFTDTAIDFTDGRRILRCDSSHVRITPPDASNLRSQGLAVPTAHLVGRAGEHEHRLGGVGVPFDFRSTGCQATSATRGLSRFLRSKNGTVPFR